MRKRLLLVLSLTSFVFSCASDPSTAPAASPKLSVAVTVPAGTPDDAEVFLASNVNNWTPGDPQFRLKKGADGVYRLTFGLTAGFALQYKFTRGGWDKVEKDEAGREIGNREWLAETDGALELAVGAWADLGSSAPSKSTVSGIVDLVDDYPKPPAGGERLLRVRLPYGYATSGESYRVLYLMDAQNLFDDATSFVGEWHVDETLSRLEMQGLVAPTIVVGIDNAGMGRQNEYSPYLDNSSPVPGGAAFADYLVTTLKPWIDDTYRTLPDSEHTAVGGSSMGGLISVYAAMRHPGVFGQVASFSGAFWFGGNALARDLRAKSFDPTARVYLDVGTREVGAADQNLKMVNDSREVAEILRQKGFADNLRLVVDEGAPHNEAAWSRRFGPAAEWLFGP